MRMAFADMAQGMYFDPRGGEKRYFITNEIGANIWRISKKKICNRALTFTKRYKHILCATTKQKA